MSVGKAAISVSGIGKRYEIMHRERNADDSLVSAFASGLGRMLKRRKHSVREDFWALRDVSFEVRPGERVGIIGRNGAGKSTLLKILSRVVRPSAGTMEYGGRLAGLLEVGTGFHGELTGRENIYLNGSILGMGRREIDAKFDEIVAFSEVEKFLDTPVKRYSSGMYVRLAFSVAAHLESDILIVDEVLAVGDASFQEKCIGKIGDSQREGKTVLFVSHNIGQVAALCNRGIYLEQGRLVMDGSVQDAMDLYLNRKGGEGLFRRSFEATPAAYSLVEIDIKDAAGKSAGVHNHDAGFDIRLSLNCVRQIADAVLGLTIYDMSGRKVTTAQLSLADKMPVGVHTIVARMPARFLMPGEYNASVAVHIPNMEMIDDKPHAASFRIVDNGSEFYRYSGDLGVVFPRVEWIH